MRIAGVNVGKVTDVKPMGKGVNQGAVVSMEIEDKGLPIHIDATATIRPRIFLEGNFFVDIHPGTPSAPKLGDGDTIQIQNTRTPVQLDQILTSLQSDTRHNLQILLDEYSKAVQPPGSAGYNASIPYWEPAYKNSAQVNQAALGLKEGDLSGFIRDAGTVAEALDASPPELQALITNFNRMAAAFAGQQSSLEQTVTELPHTLHAAKPALDALNASFPALRSLAAALRPAVRSSGPAIDASMPLIGQARKLVSTPELRGLVADLVPTVPSLAQLNDATVPLLQQVRAASSCQNEVILPWTKQTVPDPNFPAKHDVAGEAPQPLVGLSGEGRSASPNGYWFRIMLTTGNFLYDMGRGALASTALPLLGTNPAKAHGRALGRQGDPAPEDAARRDLPRAHAGDDAGSIREGRRLPQAVTGQAVGPARRDLPGLRPGHPPGVAGLAAGPGAAVKGRGARTSTTRSATCPRSSPRATS